jgi:predicted N-acyltransferase
MAAVQDPTTQPQDEPERITVAVCDSLAHLSDAALDAVTANASIFFDRRWFRMLDALDLGPLLGAEADFRYVVVSRGGEPIGLCPFLVARGSSIYWYYSLEKLYFTGWQTQLLTLDPRRSRQVSILSRLVQGYRAFARATGVRTGGWVLAISPLSYAADIVLAPMPAEEARRTRAAVIAALRRVADDEDLPLCFFGVREDQADLRAALAGGDGDAFLVSYDHLLPVSPGGFEDYLTQFSGPRRRSIKYEIKRAQHEGLEFEVIQEFGEMSDLLARLYDNTASKYGNERLHKPAVFWSALHHHLGAHARALVVSRKGEPIGFIMLLDKQDNTWAYHIGRVYDQEVRSAAVYFNLCFYEPLRHALPPGTKRYWLGFGLGRSKRSRGAQPRAVYNYFWFPRRWDRAVLVPYLWEYGRMSRRILGPPRRPGSASGASGRAARSSGRR